MAIAAGLAVANVYVAHPLLDLIGKSLAFHPAEIGFAVTLAQIGYAIGLIFLVPLTDIMDRRRLIVGQTVLSAVALVAVAYAPTKAVLLVSLAMVGALAVTVQTLVAYAGALAAPQERGIVVGKVTSGVVVGILAARAVSGSVGDLLGWRAVYLLAAAASAMAALALRWMLPPDGRQAGRQRYGKVLRSLPRLFAGDRAVRLRAAFAFVIFAAFSTFWTALVLPLTAPGSGLSHTEVGLFGLVGMAGAIGARSAGRLTDLGHARRVTGASLLLLCCSWGIIAMLPLSLWWLAAGIMLLDLAVQAVHVTSQTLIVDRHPDAAGRAIAGYMVLYSLGSATGAAIAPFMYSLWRWSGVCGAGGVISAAGFLLWIASGRFQQ
ncbi:MFS transporter [Novosphingobium soli]|uniref:MFS transporter n=1 Tax=Novosphingobium soli TaxID=574956 RepID=A0ABV6CQA2_9SPHN